MIANPYEPPKAVVKALDIVDRAQRDELATAVRKFLAEDLTAFDFDERLDGFIDSQDSAVRFVARTAWYFYDDCVDHLVAFSKAEWDFFQRLLLLLESDYRVETVHRSNWMFSQLIAFLSLLGFLWVATNVGWGYGLWLATVPFGIVSVGISWLRSKKSRMNPYAMTIFPFASFSDLKTTYESSKFQKLRYPQHIKTRQIHSPFMNSVFHFQFYAMWLLLSPIALMIQTLPSRDANIRVIME